MIACYDLARCPPTYDVVAFLALAELERIRRGEDFLDIHILPGPVGGFRRDSLWPHSIDERRRMLDEVVMPLCGMLPSARAVHRPVPQADVQMAVGWGRGEYFIGLPAIVTALKQGCRPLRPPSGSHDEYAGLITFTLRESEHHVLRNSRTTEWVTAARHLAFAGFKVVVVRDTLMAFTPLEGVTTIASAALDVSRRAQLYGRATLNVGICNGPMWMSVLMDAPTLMLRPTTPRAGGCYDDAFYASCGLPRGSQLPTSPPHQRLAWCEDYYDDIMREVRAMLKEVM